MELSDLLADLSSRLPELEWKIKGLGKTFPVHNLPKGLFHSHLGFTGANAIAEIKADILALSRQKNQRSRAYLALKIQQKINVLVGLCKINKNKPQEEKTPFGLNMLSTRQQWILSLEKEVESLSSQQQALLRTSEQMKQNANVSALLNLQKELGALEKQLTLAREALNKAIS